MKTGRQEDKTAENKERFLEALTKSYGIVSTAAKKCKGVSEMAHYHWMRNDPEYKEKVNQLLDLQIDLAESTLMEGMNNGSIEAAKFFLKYRGHAKGYKEKSEMDVKVTDGTIKFEFGDSKEEV